MRARAVRALPAVLLTATLLGAWECYVDAAGVEADLLPAPHAVAAALWNNGSLVWRNFTVTAEQVVLGLALALACGFLLAVAIHLSPLLRRAFYPLAVGSQAVPIPVIGVVLVGLRHLSQAGGDRADLLLSGAGDDRRRPGGGGS